MDFGLVRLVQSGLRFAAAKSATTYVGIRLLSSPATAFDLKLPTTLPNSTQAVSCDTSGQLAFFTPGTVSSVALSGPSDLTISGSPITTSGTISIARASQSANTFLGAPSGATGTPTYRTLVAADIPTLTASKISDFDTQVRVSTLNQMAVPTTAVNFNSQRITSLADPVGSQDAVTKAYADALIATGNNKGTVRVASTANVNISLPGGTLDSVTLIANDLILLKDQTTASENGLYVWSSARTPLVRAGNANASAEVKAGLFVFVSEGTVNGNNGYTLTTDEPITLGTTALVFTQTSGAGQIIDGAGLTKTGNTLNVIGTSNRITVNADSVDIASTYVGQTSITTLGTITTGSWNGSAIPIANGGTGSNSAATARAALVVPSIYRQSFTNSSLVSGVLTVNHNLSQKYVAVQVSDENDRVIFAVDDITLTSASALSIDLTSFGTLTGTWNVVITG